MDTKNDQKPVIYTQNLVKTFGPTKALDGLSLEVRRGEVLGFLGPNGAGKSTTIRILLGLLKKDSGEVKILGGDPVKDARDIHHRIAYVPGDVNLWPNLTGGEVIDLIARLRGGLDKTLRDKLCKRFNLDTSKKSRTYSKGNRQKVALIAALASNAELLILDEPTAGLDPLMEAEFQACIREIKDQGRTVLLSSHILSQVEVLADRISIIRRGKLVETGTLQELRHLTNTTIVASAKKADGKLASMAGVRNYSKLPDGRIQFEVESANLDKVMAYLATLNITGLEAHPPTLEQLLLRHYGNNSAKTKGQ